MTFVLAVWAVMIIVSLVSIPITEKNGEITGENLRGERILDPPVNPTKHATAGHAHAESLTDATGSKVVEPIGLPELPWISAPPVAKIPNPPQQPNIPKSQLDPAPPPLPQKNLNELDPALIGSTWPPPDPFEIPRRRLAGSFPPLQPVSQCEARGLHGGKSDPNKKLLDRIRVTPDNADGHTLMCIVYTYHAKHDRVAMVRDTWGSRCDGFVVMSDQSDASVSAARVTHEGKEEYSNIWQKVRSIWKYVHLHYRDQFDWFIIGGDDLFVIPSNLRAYLRSDQVVAAAGGLDQSEPVFLGRRFQIPRGQLFNSGGAGYVLNRAALEVLNSHMSDAKCFPHQHVFAEDVNVAHCLKIHGVKPIDTRQAFTGAERFHPFTPGGHLNWRPPKIKNADGSSKDWYENYNKPWGLTLGEKCCANDSVTFHYVSPQLMPHMSALLYDCRN